MLGTLPNGPVIG